MDLVRWITVLSIFQNSAALETVPLFLIDHSHLLEHLSIEPTPLGKTGSIIFSGIVDDAIKQSSVVILFIEEKLCTEDITSKDISGTAFPNLREDLLKYRVKYMPNVVNPINTMARILEPTPKNVLVLKPGQKFKLTEDFKYFYVFFKDNKRGETRIETLRRHDKIIREVYETTREASNGHVVAFYTGKTNPTVISDYKITSSYYDAQSASHKSLRVNSQLDNRLQLHIDGVIVRFFEMRRFYIDDNGTQQSEDLSDVMTVVGLNTRKSGRYARIPILIQFGPNPNDYETIEFNFKFYPGYWTVSALWWYKQGKSMGTTYVNHIRAPHGYSFLCDEPIYLLHNQLKDRSFLSIEYYQIFLYLARSVRPPTYKLSSYGQANEIVKYSDNFTLEETILMIGDPTVKTLEELVHWSRQPRNESLSMAIAKILFKKKIQCNPYVNISIMTILFITSVCLIGLMLGIVALLNCKSNDRFDDPLAKTLIIATEG